MKRFIIEGNHLKNGDDFYNQIEKLFLPNSNLDFGRNLDAFADILYGGFGSFEEKEMIEIVWKDFEISKKYLKNIDVMEEIIQEQEHIKFIKA